MEEIMFESSSYHTVDDKGRVIMPARFRDGLKDEEHYGAVLTYWDGCLYGYAFKEWEALKLSILAGKSTAMRSLRRLFIGRAQHVSCDKQHRILIPQALRGYADIKTDIVMVGSLDRFEIWDLEKWEAQTIEMEKDLQRPEAREEIAALGL